MSEKISKFLSYVLRHRPDEIGLTLDPNGWALVSDLIDRSKSASVELTEEMIREIASRRHFPASPASAGTYVQ